MEDAIATTTHARGDRRTQTRRVERSATPTKLHATRASSARAIHAASTSPRQPLDARASPPRRRNMVDARKNTPSRLCGLVRARAYCGGGARDIFGKTVNPRRATFEQTRSNCDGDDARRRRRRRRRAAGRARRGGGRRRRRRPPAAEKPPTTWPLRHRRWRRNGAARGRATSRVGAARGNGGGRRGVGAGRVPHPRGEFGAPVLTRVRTVQAVFFGRRAPTQSKAMLGALGEKPGERRHPLSLVGRSTAVGVDIGCDRDDRARLAPVETAFELNDAANRGRLTRLTPSPLPRAGGPPLNNRWIDARPRQPRDHEGAVRCARNPATAALRAMRSAHRLIMAIGGPRASSGCADSRLPRQSRSSAR